MTPGHQSGYPTMNVQPYDFAQARAADEAASKRQRAAEQFIIDTTRDLAEAERVYRQALAVKILALKADGMAWTTCGDVARGDEHVATLKHARDVADGVREAASQAAWRASKDRDGEHQFITWSMRRDLAEGVG